MPGLVSLPGERGRTKRHPHYSSSLLSLLFLLFFFFFLLLLLLLLPADSLSSSSSSSPSLLPPLGSTTYLAGQSVVLGECVRVRGKPIITSAELSSESAS